MNYITIIHHAIQVTANEGQEHDEIQLTPIEVQIT